VSNVTGSRLTIRLLDKRERSFQEVYILPFEPREIAQAGPGEVTREDHSAPFPIGGIKQFEDLIWSKEATTRLGGSALGLVWKRATRIELACEVALLVAFGPPRLPNSS